MIHGNHDDPGGESNLCAANILEAARRVQLSHTTWYGIPGSQVGGLCNYFGRHEDLEDASSRAGDNFWMEPDMHA